MHPYIKDQTLSWRSGVVLERQGTKALITETYGIPEIVIKVKGVETKELITLIAESFDSMYKRFENLKVKKLIPCNCKTCRNLDDPSYYEYMRLIKRKEDKKVTIECDLSYENVEITSLLDGVFTIVKDESEFVSHRKVALKAFISYSKFDGEESKDAVNYLEDFKSALNPLIEHNKLIETFDDTLLIAGEDWDNRIREELQSADIVFILVSNNLLRTKYITKTELKIAFDREAEGKCITVPIIIKDCGWEDISWLAKNNAVPRKGNTISSWQVKFKSKDQAWKHVYDEIKKITEGFLSKEFV